MFCLRIQKGTLAGCVRTPMRSSEGNPGRLCKNTHEVICLQLVLGKAERRGRGRKDLTVPESVFKDENELFI